MELNWSTFLLEIINFLVLVWILKHFLYRPVLEMLEKRREIIQKTLDDATSRHTQALALEQQYSQRLDQWALEKQQLRDELQLQLQTEKTQGLEQLQTELASERQKMAEYDQRQKAETLSQYQQNAHQQAARFASRLLTAVASEDLQSRLFDIFIDTLDKLDEARKASLLKACQNATDMITVSSAYAVAESQRQQLQQKLCALAQQPLNIHYQEDSSLLAGFRIVIGAWVLHINLQDELSGFADLARQEEHLNNS